ncbi:hypothetical protein [Silvibacterium dinghuense]|uniref:Carboxypeptidase regulatory-like domain-containing protein n=1 Tax=Silvibacterium dinghuense TaxID=1560006 RepID=A0A4Q1SGJ1_9BACT|nr:hypothetical protein [Silvibacterium dinghuense]RXS96479.1 hypothetical protein ESZ00_00515 [Silvibacterium dinghuense]GGG91112.1 hypothetical protein GCM10011586_02080 [Silvibacterium dinghuense]
MKTGVSLRCLTALPLLAIGLAATALHGQDGRGRKYQPPPPTAKITVTVTKATNGKPVENAAVIFHPMKNGKDEGGLELKTNEEGKAVIEVIPIGDVVRLQIIANGFQTFGDDYPITTDTRDIEVKLKRPSGQYSIYEKHADTQRGGATATGSTPTATGSQANSSSTTQPQQ